MSDPITSCGNLRQKIHELTDERDIFKRTLDKRDGELAKVTRELEISDEIVKLLEKARDEAIAGKVKAILAKAIVTVDAKAMAKWIMEQKVETYTAGNKVYLAEDSLLPPNVGFIALKYLEKP